MTLLNAINSNKPFRLTDKWRPWIKYTDDPYPWFMYAECNTWLKQFRIEKMLFKDGGFISDKWETYDDNIHTSENDKLMQF